MILGVVVVGVVGGVVIGGVVVVGVVVNPSSEMSSKNGFVDFLGSSAGSAGSALLLLPSPKMSKNGFLLLDFDDARDIEPEVAFSSGVARGVGSFSAGLSGVARGVANFSLVPAALESTRRFEGRTEAKDAPRFRGVGG